MEIENNVLPFKLWVDADALPKICLLYTSDAADERSSVDLGGRRIIKKKKKIKKEKKKIKNKKKKKTTLILYKVQTRNYRKRRTHGRES